MSPIFPQCPCSSVYHGRWAVECKQFIFCLALFFSMLRQNNLFSITVHYDVIISACAGVHLSCFSRLLSKLHCLQQESSAFFALSASCISQVSSKTWDGYPLRGSLARCIDDALPALQALKSVDQQRPGWVRLHSCTCRTRAA